MADFCKQCSIEHFGKDFGELAGLTTEADFKKGLYVVTLCEGCGPIQVLPDGSCIGNCSVAAHRPPIIMTTGS